MLNPSNSTRRLFGIGTLLVSLIPQGAFARGERVMGAASEGGQLQVKYIAKMEKLDLDRKQCRKDIEAIVHPQMALMDELGIAGQAGPARAHADEARLAREAQKMTQMQSELLALAKQLNQNQNGKDRDAHLRTLQSFEQRMRDYTQVEKRTSEHSSQVLARAERAATNFVPFAKAVLQIRRTEACAEIWQDLRQKLPLGMEQTVLNNRKRVKLMVAGLNKSNQNFATAATRFLEKFKPVRAVAVEDSIAEE